MLAAVQRTALAAGQALGQTAQAAAGCRGATDGALSAQGAALSAFQQDFAASMAQDQVQAQPPNAPEPSVSVADMHTGPVVDAVCKAKGWRLRRLLTYMQP